MNNLKLIKLSNGEDIVCNVTKESQNFVDVHLPLKMSLINRETEYGMVESLTMRHWIEPLSEKSDYSINKKTIVTMTEASAGLGVFYEKMIVEIKKSHKMEIKKPYVKNQLMVFVKSIKKMLKSVNVLILH